MKLSLYKFRTFIQNLVYVSLFMICHFAFSQQNIYKAESNVYSSQQIVGELNFVDPEILVPNKVSVNPKAYVKIYVDNEQQPFVWRKTTIEYLIIPYLSNGQLDEANQYNHKFIIEYNPLGHSNNFSDLVLHVAENKYGLYMRFAGAQSLDVQNQTLSTDIPTNVKLVMGFESERYYELSNQIPIVTPYFETESGATTSVDLSWQPLTGAVEYQLEWTWIDNYGTIDSDTPLSAANVPLTVRDFELNSTRILTRGTNYQIPLTYDRGFLVYRVRAVSRFLNDTHIPFYGKWSSGYGENYVTVANWTNSYIVIEEEHEKSKFNWQFQTSYAEEGKKKEVISYFDGSLRNRQTVTKINSNKNAIVGEVIYDTEGRAAIEVLPVPVKYDFIKFYKDFNLNTNSTNPQLYTHLDFDWDLAGEQVLNCTVANLGMNPEYGSSNYYSKYNTIENPFRNYIPAAFNYPFSQIEYTPDNTGRIRRKGGVGPEHQLGSGHEMKYYYSDVEQEQLNRLFGYHVGNANHYKRNIVVDPNNQVSVSYIDPQGRTIATALAGDAPQDMVPLDDEVNGQHDLLGIDLLAKLNANHPDTPLDKNILNSTGNFPGNKDVLLFTKELGVAGTNVPHHFNYNFQNNNNFEFCGVHPFVYKLNLSLKNECGEEIFLPNEMQVMHSFEPYYNLIPDNISLDTGTYSLTKSLSIHEELLNQTADQYVANLQNPSHACYIPRSDFNPLIDLGCETTCEECNQSIEVTENAYIIKRLNGLYNVPSDLTIFTLNLSGELTIGSYESNSGINFGQTIDQQEAESYVVTFKNERNQIKSVCDYLCGLTFASGCKIDETMLLTDVSPNGQYGNITGIDPLSVFNTNNSLVIADGSTPNYTDVTNNNWKHPISPYLDENGEESLIQIEEVGPGDYLPPIVGAVISEGGNFFVLPQNLENVNDFISRWKTSWAKSLLGYHPEYCYLEYTESICAEKKNVNVYTFVVSDLNTVISSTVELNKPLSSDEYDAYLGYIDTYEKLLLVFPTINPNTHLNSGTINFIFSNDPFFEELGVENSEIQSLRRAVMLEALTTQYENFADSNLVEENLFKTAYRLTVCNAIQTCIINDYDFDDLTTAQQNVFWNTYKSLYISLKQKIKHVFRNIYALQNGCYNGCIGELGSDNFENLLIHYNQNNTYSDIQGLVNLAETTYTASLCAHTSAPLYSTKQKRFIPVDYSYDADNNLNDEINNLMALGVYEYYLQTGNCPLMNDLDLFLKGFFEDLSLSTTTINLNGNQVIGQSLTAKLFEEFTGINTTPVSNASMSTEIDGSNLTFSFGPNGMNQLNLALPSGFTYGWNSYGLQGNTWRILSFSQLFFDEDTSQLSAIPPVFSFKVIARVRLNGSDNTIDILLTGKTIARIGDCHLEREEGVGEVLVPTTSQCDQKNKLANSLKNLIVNLQLSGQIEVNNSSIDISNSPEFLNGYIKSYMVGNQDLVYASIGNNGLVASEGVYYIIANVINSGGVQMTLFTPQPLNSSDLLLNLTILEIEDGSPPFLYTNSGVNAYHKVILKLNTPNGIVNMEAALTRDKAHALYFDCCSECGEWDHNFNGNGDLCEEFSYATACAGLTQEETCFEENFKNVLNYFAQQANDLSNSSGVRYTDPTQISSNVIIGYFITSCALTSKFQTLRDWLENRFSTSLAPVQFNHYSSIGSADIFDLYLEGVPSSNNGIFLNNTDTSNIRILGLSFSVYDMLEVYDFDITMDAITSNTGDYLTDNLPSGKIKYRAPNGEVLTELIYLKMGTHSEGDPLDSWGLTAFCPFLSEDYSSGVIDAPDNINNLNRFSSPAHAFRAEENPPSTNTQENCNCIPQTVEPILCREGYLIYKDLMMATFNSQALDLLASFELSPVNSYHLNLEVFCNMNLQYIVEPYEYYLDVFNVTSIEDSNFLTLVEFGNTFLNYGYNNTEAVIDLYYQYVSDNQNNPDLKSWNEYVNTVYISQMTDCPPAPMPTFSIPFTPVDVCGEFQLIVNNAYELDSYQKYILEQREKFIAEYIEEAMTTAIENFTLRYKDKEYQYTLYYYDQAGNLTKTIAPEGVNRFQMSDGLNNDINDEREGNGDSPTLVPNHKFKTEYQYNSLNQLVKQETPDGGITRFAYDRLGRIIASQNANQILGEDKRVRFSYTKYDELGRITEAGEVKVSSSDNYLINDEGKLIKDGEELNGFPENLDRNEVTRTLYDIDPVVETIPNIVHASELFITNPSGTNPSFTNRNRVTAVLYNDALSNSLETSFDNAIYYNYDVHGNVKELVHYNTYLKNISCNPLAEATPGTFNDCEKHIKRITYEYDLISGNVNKVFFQPNKLDQFTHRYNYDADNRIVSVETSSDGAVWEKDANYQYYPHGPLARTELGNKRVQGIDYAYTLHGWLKVVNGENLKAYENDMGLDGRVEEGRTKTKDAYGYSLTYYDNDYTAIENDNSTPDYRPLMFSRNNSIISGSPLYNGNINKMVTAIRKNEDELLFAQNNVYAYDQLNRISSMQSKAIKLEGDPTVINSYQSSYTYDKNGNLKSLNRNAPTENYSSISGMDKLEYKYDTNTNNPNNKLLLVNDIIPSNNFDDDLDDQQSLLASEFNITYDINDPSTHNYQYDAIGQLVRDVTEGLTIYWRVDGKVKYVKKEKDGIISHTEFIYDGLGNRIAKKQIDNMSKPGDYKATYYVRDAQGNVLAVYDLHSLEKTPENTYEMYLKEHHIYGSSRLGLENKEKILFSTITVNPDPKKKIATEPIAPPQVLASASSTEILSGIIPFIDYALSFGPTTVATWDTNAINSDITRFDIDTKLKFNNTSLSNGDYFISTHQNHFSDPLMDILPITTNACYAATGTDNVFQISPITPNFQCPTHVSMFSTNSIVKSNEDFSVEFKILPPAPTNRNRSKVGFSIKYSNVERLYHLGYESAYENKLVFTYSNPSNPNLNLKIVSDFAQADAVDTDNYKLVKIGNQITAYKNSDVIGVGTISTTLLSNLDVRFYANNLIYTTNVTISEIKFTKLVDIKNEIDLYITKSASGYSPKFKISKYSTSPDDIISLSSIQVNAPSITLSEMLENGLEIQFSGLLGASYSVTSNEQEVSANLQYGLPVLYEDDIPELIENQIGGSIVPYSTGQFDMCYYNYRFTNSDFTPTTSFGFDDVTSFTQTSNTPNSTNGIPMSVTPSVVRVLGPCLYDQDNDGIYDIYEASSHGATDFITLDTDGDGLLNYEDPDDDGDGILTIHEGADPDGNHNPFTGTTPLNTNGVYNSSHPNMIVNNIPNYLDVDDDGDGYATWETIEGGIGVFNFSNPGTPYTLNDDYPEDNIPNYLDYTSQIYPANLEIKKRFYASLIGDKRYELSNHLGNVLVVINDKKIPYKDVPDTYFNADIMSYNDYYPFGMLVPNRHHSYEVEDYRYSFQGQEKDDELKGKGKSINYTFRMHDTRVGRFFARDPLEKYYAEQTPYQFSSNAPIHAFELEGMETSFDLRFKHRERRYLAGEISESQFREENNAEAKGAIAGALIVASVLTAGKTLPLLKSLFWSSVLHFSRNQLLYIGTGNAATGIAVGFLDDTGTIQAPGPIDDFARTGKLVIGNFVKSKFTQKFTVTLGKLDFGLGRGTTVNKDLAKMTMTEITNMAKSLIRSEKLKQQGIDNSEKLIGLTSKALNVGADVGEKRITKHGVEFTKQIKLDDGTEVNITFLTREKDALPEVTSFSLPEINKTKLKEKIKELKDKAVELGNKIIK